MKTPLLYALPLRRKQSPAPKPLHHLLRRLLWGAMVLNWTGPGHAEVIPSLEQPALSALPQAPLLAQVESHYRSAVLAMEQGELQKAREALERVLEQNPANLGARLDLALACYHLGDHECARQQLETLEWLAYTVPVPVAARQAMNWLKEQLYTRLRQPESLKPAGLWFAEIGHDTNANLGADERDVRLNLWGELPLYLQLADESLQTSDQYAELGAMVLWPVLTTAPDWVPVSLVSQAQWVTGFSHRAYRRLEGYEQSSLYAGIQWYQPAARQRLSIMANQQWLGLEPYRLYLLFDTELPLPGSERWFVTAHYEWIHEQTLNVPSSQRLRLGGGYRAGKVELMGDLAWHSRPGRMAGDTVEARVYARHQQPLSSGWLMTTHAGAEYTADSAAYSQQFFGDRQRREMTRQVGLEISRRWTTASLSWNTTYEHTRSTIPFNQRSRLVTRLRYRMNW